MIYYNFVFCFFLDFVLDLLGFFQVFQVKNDKIPGDFLQGTATMKVDKCQKMSVKRTFWGHWRITLRRILVLRYHTTQPHQQPHPSPLPLTTAPPPTPTPSRAPSSLPNPAAGSQSGDVPAVGRCRLLHASPLVLGCCNPGWKRNGRAAELASAGALFQLRRQEKQCTSLFPFEGWSEVGWMCWLDVEVG